MTESDRHVVICAVSNLMYNDGGSIVGDILGTSDVVEIEEWLRELDLVGNLGCRMPTREEIEVALFQVMGAKYLKED